MRTHLKNGCPRVGLFGNMCNNLYQIASLMRDELNVDAHLFIDENHPLQMRPESDNPALAERYPEWIQRGKYIDWKYYAFPYLSPLVKKLSSFEFVILSEHGPMFAPFLRAKKAFFVSGGDITQFPFPIRRYATRRISVVQKIGAICRGYWQRKGIRSMDLIWSQPFAPLQLAEERLGVTHLVSDNYFPVPIDTDEFSPATNMDANDPWHATISAIKAKFAFTVFHPSRFAVLHNTGTVETGDWKNNLLLLHGFKQFLETSKINACLILIDKAGQKADKSLVVECIHTLNLEKNIHWLTPENGQIPRRQLASIYRTVDCVANDFGIGWFGSVVLEGLSTGKPVLNSINETAMKKLYTWHPILNVQSTDDIASRLLLLATDSVYREKVGTDSRKWIMENHSRKHCNFTYRKHLLEFFDDTRM